jgi:hypothetical protein
MLENQRLLHVLLFGDGVLLVVAVWLFVIIVVVANTLVFHESRGTHSFLQHIHFRRQKHSNLQND